MNFPAADLVATLTACDVSFFAGVPDSLLAAFCAEIAKPSSARAHHVTANEGSAIGLAAGYHLATGRVAAVYMQNSGLGNAVNPLTSLADPLVYGIPLVLIVGWRAEMRGGQQLHDEPQHVRQGQITLDLLDTLAIPAMVLGDEGLDAVATLVARARRESRPVAIVVRKDILSGDAQMEGDGRPATMTREEAIAAIAKAVDIETPIVATTGKIARELYAFRQQVGANGDLDFLTVGSMGHASQIAAGIAMARPDQTVVCLDGDGAALMHLGGLTVSAGCANLRHVVLNNRVHDSVGGQPTSAPDTLLATVALACGYGWSKRVDTPAALQAVLPEFLAVSGAAFLEVMVRPGARGDLGRPKRSPQDAKTAFMTRFGSR